MLTRLSQIKCDGCGKFIGIQDLMEERASHHLITPSSHFSTEQFESLCPKCRQIPETVR
jgi:hypothetical protein